MFSDIMENKDNSFNLICTYFDAVALILNSYSGNIVNAHVV